MNKNILIFKGLLIVCFTSFSTLVAQSKRDSMTTKVVIDVVKSYAPTIADAYKKREDAIIKDSLTVTKKEVSYSIYSVPVASTFVPEKGKATAVKKTVRKENYFDSYVGGAFGNLNTLYGDASVTLPITQQGNLAFLFNHLSSNGEVKNVIPENSYGNTLAELRYDFSDSDINWGIGGDFGRSRYHWYGIKQGTYTDEQLRALPDLEQIYKRYGLTGYLKMSNPYFRGVDLELRGFSDIFDSSEFNLKAQPSFQIPISQDEQKIHVAALLDYYSGKFSRSNLFTVNEIKNQWFILGANPSYNFTADNLDLKVGVALAYAGTSQSGENKFKAYPDVEVAYKFLNTNTVLHAGIRGMMQQNTFGKLSKDNPYVAPMQTIVPTSVTTDIFGGIKGEIGTGTYYKVQANYKQYENLPLFTTNFETGVVSSTLAYQHLNSFRLIYDKVNEFSFTAGLGGTVSNRFFFDFEGKISSYSTDQQKRAWNLPQTQITLFTDVKIIEKLFAGLDMFYVGTRYDLDYTDPSLSIVPTEMKLDGYFDLNFHIDYRATNNLVVFGKVHNLLSDNYNRWVYYPVNGLQAFAGVKYLFSLKKK